MKRIATVLAIAALAGTTGLSVGGCDTSPPVSPRATTPDHPVERLDTLKSWGRAATGRFAKCEPEEYGCFNDKLHGLFDLVKIPSQEDRAAVALGFWATEFGVKYQDWATRLCGYRSSAPDVRCVELSGPLSVLRSDIKTVAGHLADGTPVDAVLQRKIDDLYANYGHGTNVEPTR